MLCGPPGSQEGGPPESPTAPFLLPASTCSSPLCSGRTQADPAGPSRDASSLLCSPPQCLPAATVGGPAAHTPPSQHGPTPRAVAVPGEGAGGLHDPGNERLGRLARVLPWHPPRTCHLGLFSSPPFRVQTPGLVSGGPGPRLTLLGPLTPAQLSLSAPRLSLPSLSPRRPSQPQVGQVRALVCRLSLTWGKGRCVPAQSPHPLPPASARPGAWAPRISALR